MFADGVKLNMDDAKLNVDGVKPIRSRTQMVYIS